MPEDTNQLFLMLGRLEGKVDTVLNKQIEAATEHAALEKRVVQLEAQHNRNSGVFTSVKLFWVAAAGFIGAFSDNIWHMMIGK